MGFFKEMGIAARCFFDWPMLHTRIYVYAFLAFAGYEVDKIVSASIRLADNQQAALAFGMNSVLFNTADYMITGALIVIAFYVSPKVATTLSDLAMNIFGRRFGLQPRVDGQPEAKPPPQV